MQSASQFYAGAEVGAVVVGGVDVVVVVVVFAIGVSFSVVLCVCSPRE